MDIKNETSPLICEYCGNKAGYVCDCQSVICDDCIRGCERCYQQWRESRMCIFCLGNNDWCEYCCDECKDEFNITYVEPDFPKIPNLICLTVFDDISFP